MNRVIKDKRNQAFHHQQKGGRGFGKGKKLYRINTESHRIALKLLI